MKKSNKKHTNAKEIAYCKVIQGIKKCLGTALFCASLSCAFLSVHAASEELEQEPPSSDNTQSQPAENNRLASQMIHFDLPGQSLANALIEFAIQAQISIFVPQHLVLDSQSNPIIGRYPLESALTQLLAKTPLTFDYTSDGQNIVIKKMSVETKPEIALDIAPPSISVEEVQVTSRQFPFKFQTMSESSTIHPGISQFESARYINILPQTFIQDMYPLDLMDALKNSSGVTPADGLAGSNDDFYLRGFPRNSLYIDRFRLGSDVGVKFGISSIQRVEVLKGPSTLNFGQSEPGGVVNIIPKKPERKPSVNINIDYGNLGYQKFAVDSTGPIGQTSVDAENNSLFYRFNFESNQQDQSANFLQQERVSAAGALSWIPNPDNVLDFSYKILSSDYTNPQNTVILVPTSDGRMDLLQANVPTNLSQNQYDAEFGLFSASWIHYFSPFWNAELKYFYQTEERDGIRVNSDSLLTSTVLVDPKDTQIEPNDIQIIIVNGQIVPISSGRTNISGGDFNQLEAVQTKSIFDENSEVRAQLLSAQLQGTVTILGNRHHPTLGMDIRNEIADSTIVFQQRDDFQNIIIGEDGVEVFFRDEVIPSELITRSQRLNYSDFGLYAQDNIEILDNLTFSIGGRYTYTEGYSKDLINETRELLPSFHDLSLQSGIVFKPLQNTSVYLNYSEAMKANYRIDDVGSRIDKPELSNQIELGIKQLSFDERLQYTASIYHIVKENIASLQYEDGIRTSVLGDTQYSEGLELDFTLQYNSRLNFVGSFSVMDAGFKSGQYVGNKPALVSDVTASIYADFSILNGRRDRLNTSLGTYYVGERFGDDDNTYYLEPFATLDASIKYTRKVSRLDLEAGLYLKNLTDETYISSMEGQLRKLLGEQRRVVSIIKLKF